MIALLHGAKKNVGDFLIFERCRSLVSAVVGHDEFLEIPRWLPMDEHLEAINGSEAAVICGGPAYAPDFYPRLLPLTEELSKIKVPIVPVGIGWSGHRSLSPEAFAFQAASLRALHRIHRAIPASGVRDFATLEILRRHEIRNVVMSGCPALYDEPSIGRPFRPPAEIGRVVITEPASPCYYPQIISLLRAVRRQFPDALITLAFHRGLKADDHTPRSRALAARGLAALARGLGAAVRDVSFDTRAIDFYREADLHIGYRVHAHVFFTSVRKPTFLLQEDGRGRAMSAVVGVGDVDANQGSAVREVMEGVREGLGSGFSPFASVAGRIDSLYREMLGLLSVNLLGIRCACA